MLTLTAKIINVFPTAEFKDKKTGEITPAGHKVQMQYDEPVKAGGFKVVLKDMNVRLHGEAYRKCIDKTVSVGVGIWVDTETRKPGLYIPDGTLPTVITSLNKPAM
jgi:hypothetical protein